MNVATAPNPSGHPPSGPVPIEPDRGFWSEWGGVALYFGAMVGSTALAWQLPDRYQRWIALGFIAVGLFFDVVSVICYVQWLITRRHVSAFPVVGLVFYLWAWLCFPRAVILPAAEVSGLVGLWGRKLVDLVALVEFHLLFHAPFWLVGWLIRPAIRGKAE